MSGPMQLLAVGFPAGGEYQTRILDEIDRLEGRGVLRLLDVVFVVKNDDGTITRAVVGDDDFGDLLANVVALDAAGLFGLLADDEGGSVLGDQDPRTLEESLAPGAALVFLLIEHRWAESLFDSIADAGGALLGEGFITEEAEMLVGAEVAAMDEAAHVIAAAEAVEAEAVLESLASVSAAEETIAVADAIRAAAAADAVRVLQDAGVIEAAAAVEAAEALAAAGLIVDAAERDVSDAVAAASVTAAEVRVLRYLPTKMTFAVIADRLGISRSAAKDRAERAYRKLGVHSRADAVTRARELGLIPKSTS
jgi:DNA-binding CsgD family transcriptional regulator